MKRGGQVVYAGPLGQRSHKLVEYFEVGDPLDFSLLYFSFSKNREVAAFSYINYIV